MPHSHGANTKKTDLIVPDPVNAIVWHGAVFAVHADPKSWVHLSMGNHFAAEDVRSEEIVVHCVCDYLGDGGGGKFKEGVVLGAAGL
jgi:hypothetical protein